MERESFSSHPLATELPEGRAFLHDSVVVVALKVYILLVPQQHPVQTFILATGTLVLVWMQSLKLDPYRRCVLVELLQPCRLALGLHFHIGKPRWCHPAQG